MIKNTTTSYGWLSISMHWLSALAVIGLFAVGFWMVDLNYYSEWYRTAPHYHKSIGILLALLTIFRLGWKLTQPTLQSLGKPLEKKSAKFAHGLIYLLMLSLFTSGYLISTADGRGIDVFNWFTVPGLGELFPEQEDLSGQIHEWIAYSLIGLAILHAFAAFKHHLIDKDNTLKRMIKPIEEK